MPAITKSQRSPQNLERLVVDARARWLDANQRASKLAADLFQPGNGYGDPEARMSDQHLLETARAESERLFKEYYDLDRQQNELRILKLQRSQSIATWASFAVAAAVGIATVLQISLEVLR